MKTNPTISDTETYRKLVKTYIDLHSYETAIFWADKVATLTGTPKDFYWLAQCMYLSKEYHRAVNLLKSKNLERNYVLCNCLAVKCLLEANELTEALQILNSLKFEILDCTGTQYPAGIEGMLFDETPKNVVFALLFLQKGKVLESMDNRGLAADCYKQALQYDVYCFEAFDALVKYQMLTANEEQELLNALPITSQCTPEQAGTLLLLYESKLKKYHTPQHITPILVTPTSVSTPNIIVVRNNERNRLINELSNDGLTKLKTNLDLKVSEAERLYYNCEYQKCSEMTEEILKEDPYHRGCLPTHIACLVELKQSNSLFALAHNLVDLYPTSAISWFAVGCYYYVIEKSDLARRYLSKATSLDRLFGPAWLAYGHSFAIENEHDQAMAAYFKASQLMRGCHLPLLYIGLECGLTNNARLAEKFFKQAQGVAPEDPFVMHEMGVIAFQNLNFKTAEKHFKDALARTRTIKSEIIPKRWESLLNNLGHTCRKLKKYDEALEFHHQALLLSPQSAGTYSAIAFNHALMGHTEQAVDWFHKALGLKNDDSFCTTMLNYVIEQLAEEQPPFPDAPIGIPNFDIETRGGGGGGDGGPSAGPSDMSLTVEMDMTDASE